MTARQFALKTPAAIFFIGNSFMAMVIVPWSYCRAKPGVRSHGARRAYGAQPAVTGPRKTNAGAGGYRVEAATGAFTGVSQLWRSGLLPLVMPKNSACKVSVIGPATPLPTWM